MMKLYLSSTSPYARKVQIVVQEKNLQDQIEFISINPLEEDMSLVAGNPLGKVPVLICKDGTAIYDSPVICDYLDVLTGAPFLHPVSGEARWLALRAQAMGDGILDAALNTVMELRRPETQQSTFWVVRWRQIIDRGLEEMSKEIKLDRDIYDIGRITFIAVLSYLDLRFHGIDWRLDFPILSNWYNNIQLRASLKALQ